MQLRHLKTLQPANDQIARITALCWSPNNRFSSTICFISSVLDNAYEFSIPRFDRKLAAATADRVVHLFDESGEKKDKFSTKPVKYARNGLLP
jgi:intraflagellar transport protein 172